MDLFLDWCERHCERRTYDWYKNYWQHFLDAIPANLTVSERKLFHVQQWADSHTWNDGMKRGAMIAVNRAFNSLSKQGRIDRSPSLGLELPLGGLSSGAIFFAIPQFTS